MNNYRTKATLLIIIVVLSVSPLFSQTKCDYKKPRQAENWMFGINGRIDFNGTAPITNPSIINFDFSNGVSVISDASGNRKLFSNGMKVWNNQRQVVSNGDGLKGNSYATQNSIIVPYPDNSNKYIVFTVDMYVKNVYTDGVNYSIVDFSGNSNGDVTSKNNLLFHENASKVCAIKHENGEFYWVIFHGFGNNNGDKFYSYLVDTSGVVETPITSQTGTPQTGEVDASERFLNQRGYMKASSNGEKIALCIPIDGIVEVFDFDKSTGKISNPVSSGADAFDTPYGLEFSPDNSYLYLTNSPNNPGYCTLFQIDLSSSTPFDSPEVINSYYFTNESYDTIMQALQLGVDGKIYVSKSYQPNNSGIGSLGVIYNPDRPGLSCNYNYLDNQSNNGLYLNGAEGLAGLPDFVADFLNIPHFSYFNKCHQDTTDFEIRNTANLTPTWDFNDPDGASILTDEMKPRHIFSEPGTYEVQLDEEFNGQHYTFTENVIINPLPDVQINESTTDTIYIIANTTIRLDAGEGYEFYNWNNGEGTNRFFNVDKEGFYSVNVTDYNCCKNSDEVYVKFANLSFPNAFKPSSSNTENKSFKVIGDISALAGYSLRIFNRWGQMIFETDDPTQGWDGNNNGEPAPVGTYIYSTVFTSFESDIQPSVDFKHSGTATLIR